MDYLIKVLARSPLVKLVLLAVSVYLLKQDVVRAALPDADEVRASAGRHAWAAGEWAAK